MHGVLDGGVRVTLEDALTIGRIWGDAGGDRQSLQGRSAVLGAAVSGRDETYTRIRLRLRHLDARSLPATPSGSTRAKGLGAPASRSSALDSVRLTAGGQFDLEPAPDLGARRHYDERVGHALWLRAVDLPPRTADDREFVTPLASLLTLATGSDCPPVAVEVATAPDQPCLTVPNAGLRADAEEAVPNPSPAAASGRIRFGRRRTVARRRNDTRPACPVVAAAAVGRGGGSYALLPRPLSRAWRDGRSLPRIGEACIRSKSTKPS